MGREREFKLGLSLGDLGRLAACAGPPAEAVLQRNHYLDTADRDLATRRLGLRLRQAVALDAAAVADPEAGVRLLMACPRWNQRGQFPPAGPWIGAGAGEERFLLSIKGPPRRHADWVDRLDEEVAIGRREATRIQLSGALTSELPLTVLAPLLGEVADLRVTVLGVTQNLRRLHPLPDRLVLALDSTRFPDDSIEHEAELEFPGPATAPSEEEPPAAAHARSLLQSLFDRAGVAWTPSASGKFSRFLERAG